MPSATLKKNRHGRTKLTVRRRCSAERSLFFRALRQVFHFSASRRPGCLSFIIHKPDFEPLHAEKLLQERLRESKQMQRGKEKLDWSAYR